MSLKKLLAEYKETHISRFKSCFGDLSIKEQISLVDFILKVNEITGINTPLSSPTKKD